MRIGYARVSTIDQDLNLQIRALDQSPCERIEIEDTSVAMLSSLRNAKELKSR